MSQNNDVRNNLKTPKKVTTEAGSVEYASISEAIELDKYEEAKKKRARKRIEFKRIGHRED